MKIKKSPRADLENKRSIFFLAGLLLTLCMVLAAFEWESGPAGAPDFATSGVEIDQDLLPPPTSDNFKPPPPPMPILPDILEIVDDGNLIENELEGFEVEPPENLEIPFTLMPPEPEDEGPIPPYLASEPPGFQGGTIEAFRAWVMQNIRYPEIAVENNVSGKVYVQFTVSSKGYVKDVVVIRAADPALAREAVRVISSSPRWIPGKQGIKEVAVAFTMPVNFVIR